MVKKIFGGLFFAVAALALIGITASETVFADRGSAAEMFGFALGVLIPVVLYVLSGLFLFMFDRATKLNYVEGFKKRSKQCSQIVVFLVAYGVLMLFSAIGAGASGADNFVMSFLVGCLPYFIPLMVFAVLLSMYALPHWASKKHALNNDAALNEYLSLNETFYTYSSDNFVLASNKALFFPQLLCAVPFHQIAAINLTKQLWEQDVYFTLTNGKKFYIATKQYDRIVEAFNANTQNAQ